MEQHLSQALTVEALAKKLDMSVRQLERLFKEDTGKSPQAYARAMRLGVAAWMLRQSGKTVAAIASACGFSDASHMGREFRQAYGVPPGVYRAGGRQAAGPAAGAAPADGADYAELFPQPLAVLLGQVSAGKGTPARAGLRCRPAVGRHGPLAAAPSPCRCGERWRADPARCRICSICRLRPLMYWRPTPSAPVDAGTAR